ncbi:GTPase HflX [Formosimonas limnophila]|uniref:GTPase HflX n=1 Tax=Formosimonas limnophila TaxID=1384487 RepID=A0A8J3CNY6_9BURK|nr:GTPase HflX [Formosimonas limnophila]GHA78606.1 GTPase HflX [Formosimonas limnophila]
MRTIIVGLNFGKGDFDASMEELHLLVNSAGGEVLAAVAGTRKAPDAKLYIGSGKADEVKVEAQIHRADCIVFNHAISPAQQRNLEEFFGVRVMDRTALILDIFAQRAKSHEGKLQVEMAQLEYMQSRLTGLWTHLERQRGGIGIRGGMGESQLEIDKRLISERRMKLKAELAKFERQHKTQRLARTRGTGLNISLVGYTNAGKSTLFNHLTSAKTYAADQLFATLDTTTRKVFVEGAGQLVVSDTVGFVRDLPHQLVAAFRATLEETIQADVLLHVVDAASSVRMEQIDEVNKVLKEIEAEHIHQILIWNKIDLTAHEAGIERDENGKIARIYISAKTGEGMAQLREALVELAENHTPDWKREREQANEWANDPRFRSN